jgi:hypothetical protein
MKIYFRIITAFIKIKILILRKIKNWLIFWILKIKNNYNKKIKKNSKK